MKSIFLITALLVSFAAHSKQATKEQLSVEYYKNLLNPIALKSISQEQCTPRPDITSCVKGICGKLSPWSCDEESELKDVANTCRGNFGGDCILTTCKNLSSFECDELSELKEVAQSCKQVYGSGCPLFFTTRLSSFEHNDRHEMVAINNQCKNVSPEILDCAQYVCSKLPASSCNEFDELTSAISTCSGQ